MGRKFFMAEIWKEAVKVMVIAAVLVMALLVLMTSGLGWSFAADDDDPEEVTDEEWYEECEDGDVYKIRFVPVKEYVYTALEDGRSHVAKDPSLRNCVYYDTPEFAEGDKLILYIKKEAEEGREYEYRKAGSSGRYCFVNTSDGSDVIDPDEVEIWDDQDSVHWEPGKKNVFSVDYQECSCDVPVTILKSSHNPMEVKTKKEGVLSSFWLIDKKVPMYLKGMMKIKKGFGKISYKIVKKDPKAKKYFTITQKGVIDVKKGLKRGKYKIKVRVTSSGGATFTKKSVTVTVKMRVYGGNDRCKYKEKDIVNGKVHSRDDR